MAMLLTAIVIVALVGNISTLTTSGQPSDHQARHDK
jgi:hypothetical protein